MKTKSYLFLFILILILIFILGVRYGQKVEQTNKVINYLISITPTSPPVPTIPLEFKKYTHKGCGIQFTYPSTAEVKSEATRSALLVDRDGHITIDCNPVNDLMAVLKDNKAATAEVTFKNRKQQVKTASQGQDYVFSFYNPQNGKTIFTAIQKRLYPLFESSLQFGNY